MSYRNLIIVIFLLFTDETILDISADAESIPLENCGQRTAQTQQLVSHGDQSRVGEWPWHAAIFLRLNGSSPRYICGGTIITSRSIVTAAHCLVQSARVRRLNPSELLIRAGISNLVRMEHSLQQMMVENVTVHEEYRSDKHLNDIALLKLFTDLEFNDYVKPICLWRDLTDEKLIIDKLGYVTGWGTNERNELPDQLHHAVMPIVSRKECRKSDPVYYTTYLFDWRCFCAGFRNGTSVGLGDSGGGLYIERNGKWILRGVVSNGKFTRSRQLDTYNYMVFADVAQFVPWINNKTGVSSAETIQSVEDYFTCGKKKERQFSRAGYAAEQISPWDGDVFRKGQNLTRLCQTAVIKENFVLSPATPFSDTDIDDPSQIVVVFTRNKREKVLHVQRIVRHPKFEHLTGIGNLALLELKIPLKFSDLIKPICLWNTDKNTVKIKNVHDFNTCVTKFKLNSTMLGNYSLCQSHGRTVKRRTDLLYVQYADSWYLRGIYFSLIETNSNDFYMAASDLAHYSNWIEKNTVVKSHNLFSHDHCDNAHFRVYDILLRNDFQCFGSLILPKRLLTIASCVDVKPRDDLSIRKDGFQTDVKKVHWHPAFDKQNFTNNIAVVEMASFEAESLFCLPKSFIPLPYLKLSILRMDVNRQMKSNFIQPTGVNSCVENWKRAEIQVMTNGQHICGLIQNTEKVPVDCTANLHGAPLVYYSDDGKTRYLRGLLDISKNNHCENSNLPEVFIDVMFYVDWISTFALPKNETPQPAAKTSKVTTPKLLWSQIAMGARP